MGKQAFKKISFSAEKLDLIDTCNHIIADYVAQGLRLTLRQLYYQLVSGNVIPNTEKSYKNVGKLVSDARLAGLMDWDAIEDRNREPMIPADYKNLKEFLEYKMYGYRLNWWQGQKYYAELWVEKAALAGVLQPLASEFHVTLMVNKGYSSQSAMYESALRYMRKCNHTGYKNHQPDRRVKRPVLFYLGDHDPSGEDMVRDIRDRMQLFGVYDIAVKKIALTTEQVHLYNPPPNPAKLSDSRAKKYIAKHGPFSWEVDALNPARLAKIVRKNFEMIIDKAKMDAIKAKQKMDKETLKKLVDGMA